MINLEMFDKRGVSTPCIHTETLDWANRKDLSDFWLQTIQKAFNAIDWRGAVTYVHIKYLEEIA